jgi:fructose transport system permease protein
MDNTIVVAADDIESTSRPQSWTVKAQRLFHANETLGPAAVLLLAIITFSIVTPQFGQLSNVSLILQQTAVIGTLAVGQTLIILTAGIDLSVGGVMAFASTIMAYLSVTLGVPAPLALIIGFALGTACGLINGLLVTRLKLPPFITTLGTWNVFFALNLFISQSKTISNLDPLLLLPGSTFDIFGTTVTIGSVMMLVLFIAFAFILRLTKFGRHIYAVGGAQEASRLSGIKVRGVLLSVYAIAGLLFAIGAWIEMGRLASASPQVGTTYNLDTITAVVIGGTSLFGGRGSILGTLMGALVVSVFRNGISLAGVDVLWQNFSVGVLIIAAVGIDQWIRKVKA